MTSPTAGAWNRSTGAECHHRAVVEPEVPDVRPVRRRRSTSAQPSTQAKKRSKRAARRAEPLAGTTPLVPPPSPPGSVRIRRRGRIRAFFSVLGDHLVAVAVVVVLFVLIGAIVGAKYTAESAADSATQDRVDDLNRILAGATPNDFLAFNAGVRKDGSIAQQIRNQPDFVNVRATADLSFIRFQPDGWWSGFTERCIVAQVTETGVQFRIPKTACVRVPVPNAPPP
jgi:hypothetical protein